MNHFFKKHCRRLGFVIVGIGYSRWQTCPWSWKLRAHILNNKQQTEGSEWEWVWHLNHPSTCSVIYFLQRGPTQAALPARDHESKLLRLWGASYSKHQSLSTLVVTNWTQFWDRYPSALELDWILPVMVNKRKERSNTKMNAHNIFIIPYIGLI